MEMTEQIWYNICQVRDQMYENFIEEIYNAYGHYPQVHIGKIWFEEFMSQWDGNLREFVASLYLEDMASIYQWADV